MNLIFVFQEIMKAIVADPKVLSILNKRKGQKGWRELQGDNLKDVLLSVIQTEVTIFIHCLNLFIGIYLRALTQKSFLPGGLKDNFFFAEQDC